MRVQGRADYGDELIKFTEKRNRMTSKQNVNPIGYIAHVPFFRPFYTDSIKNPAVLLVQLGTPDEPTPKALRRYLRQFLSDPRVIEAPRLLWWFILRLFILPRRPAQSAAKYQRIWNPRTGSPLLHITKLQTAAF